MLVVIGTLVMIVGALAVSTAVATERENTSTNQSLLRECARYDLDYNRVLRAYGGSELSNRDEGRGWWDYAIVAAALSIFLYLGLNAHVPELKMNLMWVLGLTGVLAATAGVCGWSLWKATRFS